MDRSAEKTTIYVWEHVYIDILICLGSFSPMLSPMLSRPPSITPTHPHEGVVFANETTLPQALAHDLKTSHPSSLPYRRAVMYTGTAHDVHRSVCSAASSHESLVVKPRHHAHNYAIRKRKRNTQPPELPHQVCPLIYFTDYSGKTMVYSKSNPK